MKSTLSLCELLTVGGKNKQKTLVIAGMVDSSFTVGAVLEKKLQPLPFSFALSGSMNHSKNQFRLGCGFIIG
jgi:mitochondrial import receptor subunit TOM40